jgi:hypothetical protein
LNPLPAITLVKEGPAKSAVHIMFYVSNCLTTGFKNPDLFFNILPFQFLVGVKWGRGYLESVTSQHSQQRPIYYS